MPTIQRVDTFGHQTLVEDTSGLGMYVEVDGDTGDCTIVSTPVYDGAPRTLQVVNDTVVGPGVGYEDWPGTVTLGYIAFAYRFEADPTGGDARVFRLTLDNGQFLDCTHQTSSNKLFLSFTGGGTNFPLSNVLAADTWYWIEIIVDVSGTTHTAHWRIDESALTDCTRSAGASSSLDHLFIGSQASTQVMTKYYGGVIWGEAASGTDWLSPRRFRNLTANARGTDNLDANPSAFFFHNQGSDVAITPSDDSYNRLNDGALSAGTDYLLVKPAAGPTEPTDTWYAEYALANIAGGTPNAVTCIVGLLNGAAGVAEIGCKLAEGGSESTVFLGDPASTTRVYRRATLSTKPSGGAWTAAALNALTFRWGYTNDATPEPRIHTMLVEYVSDQVDVQVVEPASVVRTRAIGTAVLSREQQVAVPTADSVDGAWTDQAGGTSLFAAIDETSHSDADYIRSEVDPNNSGCRIKLGNLGDPSSSVAHEIHWRPGKDFSGGPQIDIEVRLYQGGGNVLGAGTLIADFQRTNVGQSLATFVELLSGAEADAITNYNDLYLEFYANQV